MPSAPPAPGKATMTRTAPAGATAGMEFEVSEQEMKQIDAQLKTPEGKPAAPQKTSGISKLVNFIR